MNSSSDELDALLGRSRAVRPPSVPAVAPAVWRRIHDERCRRSRPAWLTALEAAFARPSFAVAFVTACVLGGLFLAEMRLSRLHVARNTQLARSYLRLIDPLLNQASPAPGVVESKP